MAESEGIQHGGKWRSSAWRKVSKFSTAESEEVQHVETRRNPTWREIRKIQHGEEHHSNACVNTPPRLGNRSTPQTSGQPSPVPSPRGRMHGFGCQPTYKPLPAPLREHAAVAQRYQLPG